MSIGGTSGGRGGRDARRNGGAPTRTSSGSASRTPAATPATAATASPGAHDALSDPAPHTFARCLAAGFFSLLATLVFNGPLFDAHAGFADWSRDESTVVEALLLLALLAVAWHRPDRIRPARLTAVALALLVAGDTLTTVGVALRSAALVALGIPLSALSDIWGVVLWLLACSGLGTRRACLVIATGGIGAVPVAYALNLWAPYPALAAASFACSAAIPLLCLPATRPFFARLAQVGSPREQEISHPRAVLPLGHTLYVVIFAFSLAYGFGLRCEPMSSAETSAVTFFALVATAVYVWRAGARLRIDALYVASFAAVALGFMLALQGDARTDAAASALLVAGYMCCELLFWFALSMAAARNAVDAIPVVCWGTAVGYIGIMCGVGLWMVPNLLLADVLGDDAAFVQGLLVTAALGAITLHTVVTRRTFSFDATIEGIAPDAPPPTPPTVRYVDLFDDLCSSAAIAHNLTARETQVMRLLAHGNNASRVQEELGVSRNTVKYHAKNIYAKFGVHSQQELIDAIANAATPAFADS